MAVKTFGKQKSLIFFEYLIKSSVVVKDGLFDIVYGNIHSENGL